MAFQLGRRTRNVVLMVSAWPEPGFRPGGRPGAPCRQGPDLRRWDRWAGSRCGSGRAQGGQAPLRV